MAAKPNLKTLMGRLGHDFADPDLLEQAVTHPSGSSSARPDNQRLEFLGDRVLGLCVADILIRQFPNETEGGLSPRLHALVSRESCAIAARAVRLGDFLRMGRSEAVSGGRKKEAALADAMEAVIAAVYLDGGLDCAQTVVRRLWDDEMTADAAAPRNPKTALQEWAQARGLPPPEYREVARVGPDHAPLFRIRAALANGRAADAEAPSKRVAERAAAAALLAAIEETAP